MLIMINLQQQGSSFWSILCTSLCLEDVFKNKRQHRVLLLPNSVCPTPSIKYFPEINAPKLGRPFLDRRVSSFS